ncbi:MAG: hypothetical protein OXG67_04200 [bacterium]|nr:hypothetical protein [bacterium]
MRQPTAAALALVLGALTLAALSLSACDNDDQPSLETFCGRLETAFSPEGALAADYSDDPSGAQAVIDELESIQRVAPLEVESSLAVIIDTASLIIGVFSGEESARLDAAQLEESGTASAELGRYAAEHCGLDLDWDSPVVFVDPDRIPGEVRLDVRG